ncbi:UBP-type zinc finger domain-containing protein [Streptacidiphilus anmyonensis]|uniref:UBP-type zinc finger domain-containing protein n=1 Tax=Streptacidiphilus anmyonensis TaxID=405782 RepID=UPI0005A65BBD|nr:UBP-type zinc finger domain-containing protein [Streptacidiphilus anmyonensis]
MSEADEEWHVEQPPGAARTRTCDHLAPARAPAAQPARCEACLRRGDTWVNLLACLVCGEVGCCDSSPGRHAHEHAERTGHPLARTLKKGESWGWCYVDEVFLARTGR